MDMHVVHYTHDVLVALTPNVVVTLQVGIVIKEIQVGTKTEIAVQRHVALMGGANESKGG